MKQPLVCILGNSVPLLIQPFRTSADDKTYAEHLRERGFDVLNSAKQSAMFTDVYRYLEDECIRQYPDYVIIHFGIVEATYRARPRWLQNVFSMNAWNNSIINKGHNGPVVRGIKYVAKKGYKTLVEKPLFRLHLRRRWMPPKVFRFVLRDVAKRLFQDTPVRKLILVTMTPVAPWVEKQAPGTQNSVSEFNRIMKQVAEEYENILLLDTADLVADDEMKQVTVDGIHFTAIGHAKLAAALEKQLQGERTHYTDWEKINQYDTLYSIYARWNKRTPPGPK